MICRLASNDGKRKPQITPKADPKRWPRLRPADLKPLVARGPQSHSLNFESHHPCTLRGLPLGPLVFTTGRQPFLTDLHLRLFRRQGRPLPPHLDRSLPTLRHRSLERHDAVEWNCFFCDAKYLRCQLGR